MNGHILSSNYKGASSKLCIQDKKPNNLFINAPIEEGWYKSNNDWCKNCYKAYYDICKHVAYEFRIPIDEENHFNKEDLKTIILQVVESTKYEESKEWLYNHEKKLMSIINCINSRVNYHINCRRPVTYTTVRFDPQHLYFLTVLCASMLKLYILYELKLKLYNDKYNPKKPNVLLDLNTSCANNCKDILRDTDKVKELLKYFNLSQDDITNKLSTTSPVKKNKKKKVIRSRTNSSYIPDYKALEKNIKERRTPKIYTERKVNEKLNREKRIEKNAKESKNPKNKNKKRKSKRT
jgi:hypothetical protein